MSVVLLKSLPCVALYHLRSNLWLAVVLSLAVVWAVSPALVDAYHGTGGGIRACDASKDWKSKCECRYHVTEIIDAQLRDASPDPTDPYRNRFVMRFDLNKPVAWWRVESKKEACARMDLMDSARGITRLIAGAVTGLVGISFVWTVVQLMQESVSGGRVVEARNNLFRSLVGLIFFSSAWMIYEAVTVGLFGASQFTAGSFVGLTGTFGY